MLEFCVVYFDEFCGFVLRKPGINLLACEIKCFILGLCYFNRKNNRGIGLPKPSLFCNVQRDVASLPSYSKLKSNSSHVMLI